MTDLVFLRLVKQMRHAQKRYFASRTTENLEDCKRLERDVDRALLDATTQGTLFGREPERPVME